MIPSRQNIDWQSSRSNLRDGIRVRGWWGGRTQEKNHTGAQSHPEIHDQEAPV